MNRTARIATLAAGLTVAATPILTGAVPAEATSAGATTSGSELSAANVCMTNSTEGQESGRPASPATYRGYATWLPAGEKLVVVDQKSNGYRTVALFSWCENGGYVSYRRLDSGPDEGATDEELYDLEFAEGRKIKFRVCEVKNGALRSCGPIVYNHA